MNADKIRQLLDKYYNGQTTLEEEEQLRRYFNGRDIAPDLEPETDLFRQYSVRGTEKAPGGNQWQNQLEGAVPAKISWIHSPILRYTVRVAAVVFFMLTGFIAGILYSQNNRPVPTANQNAAVIPTRFEQIPSASERIKLISKVSGQIGAGKDVIGSLIQSLNNDNNVNVRLAAAQALYQYAEIPEVRLALVQSLQFQDNPNMQVTLIDMLVKLHEKRALQPMQVMLLRKDLNPIVRFKLIAGIGVLL